MANKFCTLAVVDVMPFGRSALVEFPDCKCHDSGVVLFRGSDGDILSIVKNTVYCAIGGDEYKALTALYGRAPHQGIVSYAPVYDSRTEAPND